MRSSPAPVSVSIVMPFKNAAQTLPDCLQSIQAQSLADFELIAINDHASDDSVAVIRSFADRRFRVIDNPGQGIVAALNAGISHAGSPLIARMDADDIMRPARLQRQFDCMQQHEEIDLCATQVELFPAQRIQAGYREYIRWQNRCLSEAQIATQIYVESPFAHPSVMFRRDALLKQGGYRDGEFAEDYDCWLRLFHAGARMFKIDEVLLDWRESETRLSRNSSRYSRSAFDDLRARYLAADARLQKRDIVYWGAGRKTRKRSALLIKRGFPPAAWIDIDEKKIGQRVQG
ncbi:MAG TPA: glycosyltransferase, partial [Thiotrichales bacterium]|nr:glycosyltransferase [Thiotrichales bacterium]